MRSRIRPKMADKLRRKEYAVNVKQLDASLEFTEYFTSNLGRDRWSSWGFIAYAGSREGFEYAIKHERCDAKKKIPVYGWSFLHLAAVAGHFAFVEFLIEQHKMDPKEASSSGMNALHLAAYLGHFELVKMLIEKYHMDPRVKTSRGENALDLATQGRIDIPLVDYLINQGKMNPHQKNPRGYSLLHHAASIGHASLFSHLRTRYQLDPNLRTSAGKSPLSLALEHGDFETICCISEDAADPENRARLSSAILVPRGLLVAAIKTLIQDEKSKLTEAIERLRAYQTVLVDLVLEEGFLTLSDWVTLFHNKYWVDILGPEKYTSLKSEIQFRKALLQLCDARLTIGILKGTLDCAEQKLRERPIKPGIFFISSSLLQGLKQLLLPLREKNPSDELDIDGRRAVMEVISHYRQVGSNALTREVDNFLAEALESTQTLKMPLQQEGEDPKKTV